MPAKPRSYLFLQGPVGGFFQQLGQGLRDAGHAVHRIHFNAGDRLFWSLPGAVDYGDTAERWPDFLAEHLSDWEVTDLVLFGDCRPLHRAATRMAVLREISIHVFEEGYLRPNWVTLENGGVNGHSTLPRHGQWFRDAAKDLPEWSEAAPVASSFLRRSVEDVLYNSAMVIGRWHYPGYRTHRPWHPFVEYAAGAKRFFGKPAARRFASSQIAGVLADPTPYYLFPLQLDADSQIRYHSNFEGIAPAIDTVVQSFARSAPAEARLVLTEHPLDNGVLDHHADTQRAAAAAGISGRVTYIRGGSPDDLLRRCRGLVTVNSTIGLAALGFGIPVTVLGDAIYDLPELTFQNGLDKFWREGGPADAATFDAFRRVLVARAQVNGGFFSKSAVSQAVEGSLRRLLATGTQAAGSRASTLSPPDRTPTATSVAADAGLEPSK